MVSMSIHRATQLLAVTLVILGFGMLGAMAMTRVAFATVVNTLECPVQYAGEPEPCHRALIQLNEYLKLTAGAGLAGIGLGGLGLYLTDQEDENAA